MSRRVLIMLCFTVLVGAIWAETIPVVSSARAQTAADSPAAFTGPLTELQTVKSLRTRETVYVAAYSTVRLGGGKGKVNLATTLTIHNTSEKKPLILCASTTSALPAICFTITWQAQSRSAHLVRRRPSFPLRIRAEEPGRTSSLNGRLMGKLPNRLSRLS